MDLYQAERSKAATNACQTSADINVKSPSGAAAAMPVVREKVTPGPDGTMVFPEPPPSLQQAAAKRARDAGSGSAGPAHKRLRTAGASGATQTADLPLPFEAGLLSMPDDVLLQIVAALDTGEPVFAVSNLQRFRASCKDLRQRVAEPPPELMQKLKYRRSADEIRAVKMDNTLTAQQVETKVRVLCDRYGDVRVVLSSLSFLQGSPHMRNRNHSVLAGIAASKDMRSLRLDLLGARDIAIKPLCDALQHKAPTRVALAASKMEWGNVALAKLFVTVGRSESIFSLAISCSGGRGSSSFRFMEQGGWAAKTAQALGSMLMTNRRLELLDLSAVYPGEAAMETIAQALTVNCKLNHLRLNGNGLSEKSIRVLSRALCGNVGLGTLSLDGNPLGVDGVQGLLAGLQKNRTLTTLSLSRCLPGYAAALELISLFEHNDTLRHLDLGHGAMTGPVAACLARSLQAGRHLVSLALPGNPIGSEGALAIGELLASDTMLASLNLSGCSIDDDGLIGLAQGLRKNTALRHLNLAMNRNLTAIGISALAGALKAHPCIASLSLCKLRVDRTSAQALAQGLLANHPTLESLDMSGCEMEPDGTRILVGAMEANTRLKNLVVDKRVYRTESRSDY